MGLSRCFDLLKRLYDGIHRGSVGNAEAQELMGFAVRSGSGLAALSSLKRFGLIDGRDPQLHITELGMKLVEPADDRERAAALGEAALRPALFAEIMDSFGGRMPADAVIRAKLVREKKFTSSGANAFIRSLKETVGFATERDGVLFSQLLSHTAAQSEALTVGQPTLPVHYAGGAGAGTTPEQSGLGGSGQSVLRHADETLTLRLSPDVSVTVNFQGSPSRATVQRLAKLLDILSENYE
jgi:hypothetical protein